MLIPVPLQKVPQVPQLFASVCVSVQKPPQSVCPVGQTHALFTHCVPPVQIVPHIPQLLLSLVRSTQVPLQSVCPLGQAHWPLSQCLPPVQLLLHDPQLKSVVRSWQVPQQPWPGAHWFPHPPQSLVEFRSVQVPLQHAAPLPQEVVHDPQWS